MGLATLLHVYIYIYCLNLNRINLESALTVILRGRAVGRVGYYQLISGKSEKNNCFSKFSSNSQLISSGETSANRDIFFTDDAVKSFFPTSTRNSPSVFPYLVKRNDNGSYDGLREPIRKLENHYHELKILLIFIIIIVIVILLLKL